MNDLAYLDDADTQENDQGLRGHGGINPLFNEGDKGWFRSISKSQDRDEFQINPGRFHKEHRFKVEDEWPRSNMMTLLLHDGVGGDFDVRQSVELMETMQPVPDEVRVLLDTLMDSGEYWNLAEALGVRDLSKNVQDQQWLIGVCELEKEGMVRKALDDIFQTIDSHLCEGHFERCDALLKNAAVEDMPENIMIGLLTITKPASEHLPTRKVFFERVKAELHRIGRYSDRLVSGID